MTAADDAMLAFQAAGYMHALKKKQGDIDLTMTWWRRYCGEPVLINRLRGRDNVIYELNDLIHPEMLAKMTAAPKLRQGVFPIYPWETPGCGCRR